MNGECLSSRIHFRRMLLNVLARALMSSSSSSFSSSSSRPPPFSLFLHSSPSFNPSPSQVLLLLIFYLLLHLLQFPSSSSSNCRICDFRSTTCVLPAANSLAHTSKNELNAFNLCSFRIALSLFIFAPHCLSFLNKIFVKFYYTRISDFVK